LQLGRNGTTGQTTEIFDIEADVKGGLLVTV